MLTNVHQSYRKKAVYSHIDIFLMVHTYVWVQILWVYLALAVAPQLLLYLHQHIKPKIYDPSRRLFLCIKVIFTYPITMSLACQQLTPIINRPYRSTDTYLFYRIILLVKVKNLFFQFSFSSRTHLFPPHFSWKCSIDEKKKIL